MMGELEKPRAGSPPPLFNKAPWFWRNFDIAVEVSLPRRRFEGTNDRFHVEREKRCEGRHPVLPQDAQGRIALIFASDQRR